MKKTVFLAAALLIGAGSFAQEKEKEEKVYLPEAGDWAIGIDATPFLSYFGNFIGGNDANTAPSWNYLTNNQTITGKYFESESMAYRASVRLGFGSMGETDMVNDRAADPTDFPELPPEVENNMKASFSNIGIAGGVEYRKGKGRLQGFYGAELGISYSSSKETYEYGNELTESTVSNPVFVSADDDFGTGNVTTDPFGNDARVLESKNSSSFGIGLRGFIGAEYFVLPKLAIGGEFGWGLAFNSTGATSRTTESLGVDGDGNESVEQITTESGKSNSFGIDTDSNNSIFGPAGSIRLTFHF